LQILKGKGELNWALREGGKRQDTEVTDTLTITNPIEELYFCKKIIYIYFINNVLFLQRYLK